MKKFIARSVYRQSRFFSMAVAALLGIFVSGGVLAAPTGPVYPAPGGNTFSSNGIGFQNTGYGPSRVGTYGGFDSSQYGQLYFGEASNTSIGVSMNAGNSIMGSEWMTIWSMSGNDLWLSGSTTLFNQANSTTYTVTTWLEMALYDSASNAINWVTGASVGLSGVDAVADVTAASASGGFYYTAKMWGCGGVGGGCDTVTNIFNSNNASGGGSISAQSTVSTGFFSTPPVAAIPEPETYAMLLAGLGLLGFAARRRKLKEAALA